MPSRWLSAAVLLVACHDGAPPKVTTPDDAGDENLDFVRAHTPKQNAGLFCLERDSREVQSDIIWVVLDGIADICQFAQPLLADAARAAAKVPYDINHTNATSEQDRILLRAARQHPAFPKECEISEREADPPASDVFHGRTSCADAAHQQSPAGSYVYMVVLARVAWRNPKEPPSWFGGWVAAEQYQRWKEGKVKGP